MRALLLGLGLGLLLVAPQSADAATFTANTTLDTVDVSPGDDICRDVSGKCSLRAAIQESNALEGDDTINLPAGVYYLTIPGVGEDLAATGDLDIGEGGSITIRGDGPNLTIIDGNHLDHIFDNGSGVFDGLTIQNAGGYGIWAGGGEAVLINTHVQHNAECGVSGIGVELIDSVVSDNGCGVSGGESARVLRSQIYGNEGIGVWGESVQLIDSEIYNQGAEGVIGIRVTAIRSSIHDNRDGGISVIDEGTRVELVDSMVYRNQSVGSGGGIAGCATMLIEGSAIFDNQAVRGGGISDEYCPYGMTRSIMITNTTISNNRASLVGGGIYLVNAPGSEAPVGTAALSNVTMTGNVAGEGGGLYIGESEGPVHVSAQNSIISGNTGGGVGQECAGAGEIESFGYNLIEDLGDCSIVGDTTGNIYGVDPMLDVLANNGGPTRTHALLATSPALNAGNPTGCKDATGDVITVDQRAHPRPYDGRCDIGAFESGCGDSVVDVGDVCDPGGAVRLKEVETGASTNIASVQTADQLRIVPGELYLAVVSYRRTSSTSNVSISGLTGVGDPWTPVVTQCSGRSQTGISVWMTQGAWGGDDVVTAWLSTTASAATIVVSRYSGTDTLNPLGHVVSANTMGAAGACSGGVDSSSYSINVPVSSADGLAVGAVTMRDRTHTPGAGFTEHAEIRAGTGGSIASAATEDRTIPGIPANVTVNGAFNGSTDWAAVGIELRAAERNAGCVTNADCLDDVSCDEDRCDNGSCIHVIGADLCNDGLFCNGVESCDATLGCVSGTPVPCNDGVSCTTDSCNETTDRCDHVPNNSACSDGLFCDGVETCGLTTGCQDAPDPCTAGQTCSEATDTCQSSSGGSVTFGETKSGTSTNSSSVTTSAQLTGATGNLYLAAIGYRRSSSSSSVAVSGVSGLGLTWTQVLTQCSGRSQTGISIWRAQGSPAGNGNVTATLSGTAAAAAIAVSRYSGVSTTTPIGNLARANTLGVSGACTGGTDTASYSLPLAVSSPNGMVWGAATMRATSHTPGSGFTERVEILAGTGGSAASAALEDRAIVTAPATVPVNGTFSAVTDWAVVALELKPGGTGGGCTSNAGCNDGIACTFDTCNTSTGVCGHTANNALCSDGLFCDGAEVCDASRGCRAGTAVACGDAIACTTDSCNETTDSCNHVANNAACSNGLFCDGSEVCNTTLGCQDSPDPCGAGQTCNESTDVCQGSSGPVSFAEARSGASTSSTSVTTSVQLSGVAGNLYLAAVGYRRSSTTSIGVSGVSGLGLTWTLVANQCSGRDQTGISLWKAQGTPSGNGAVTATLTGTAAAAAISVSRYSGVNTTTPVGSVVRVNTVGVSGACTGGVDTASYSMGLPVTTVNGVAFGVAAMRDKTHTPGSGYTERVEVVAGTGGSAASAASEDRAIVSAPGTLAVNGTFNSATDWAAITLEIR